MEMFILSYANVLCIYPKLCLQVGSTFWLRTFLLNQYVYLDIVSLICVNETICMVICLSTRFKSIVLWPGMTHLVPRLSQKASYGWGAWCHSEFEDIPFIKDCWWPYNIQLKSSSGVLFLPPSDTYVRSFLYLLYTLIKLYYTKALRDQASSLAPHWILLLRGPRIPATWFHNNLSSWGLIRDPSGQGKDAWSSSSLFS